MISSLSSKPFKPSTRQSNFYWKSPDLLSAKFVGMLHTSHRLFIRLIVCTNLAKSFTSQVASEAGTYHLSDLAKKKS